MVLVMTNDRKVQRDVILDANRQVHSALAISGEYNRSPHFRKENQKKVKGVLEDIVKDLSFEKTTMLDMGCGTGFIIHLALDLVDEIHGVDITDEMMSQVDLSSGKVTLQNSQAENTPFDNYTFSIVTAYSFLDHLEDFRPVVREAYRVLAKGGVFYSDLNPNRHFSLLMRSLEKQNHQVLPEIVAREIQGMLHNGDYYEENFGISSDVLEYAEPLKSYGGGLDPNEVAEYAKNIGFSDVKCEFDWYLGQAVMLHEKAAGEAEVIDSYLRMALPATRGLFKYLRFIFKK